jgi:hypothetical protein
VRSWAGDPARLTDAETSTVRWVVDRYGELSAERLSDLTHAEPPWADARGLLPEGARSDAEITHEAMRHQYGQQVLAPGAAVAHAVANAAIEGIDLDDDWVAVMAAVARGELSPDEALRREAERAHRS